MNDTYDINLNMDNNQKSTHGAIVLEHEIPIPNPTVETPKLVLDGAENPSPVKMESTSKTVMATAEVSSAIRLTDEEKQMVSDFAKTINLEDMSHIMQYGTSAQRRMADFSHAALENVRTKDLNEVGELLAGTVVEMRGVTKNGLMSFIQTPGQKLATFKARFEKAEKNLAVVSDTMRGHAVRLMKDSAVLDRMYEQNKVHFKELTMYIEAGEQKLKEVREGKLAELQRLAKASGLMEDAQAVQDLEDNCTEFEKRLFDLKLTKESTLQTAPQIRLIQKNNNTMVGKIQTTLNNAIPLWEKQMVLALGISHAEEAAAAQRAVSDFTNELLTTTAKRLHMAAVATAKESERGIIDMKTLKETNAELIKTLDDVIKITNEGRAARKTAEADMLKMECELRDRLLALSAPQNAQTINQDDYVTLH